MIALYLRNSWDCFFLGQLNDILMTYSSYILAFDVASYMHLCIFAGQAPKVAGRGAQFLDLTD